MNKEIKGLPMEFMEDGMQAKLDEIFNYRMCFYDAIHSERMEDTFNLYTKDLSDDGYALMSKGVNQFYPNNCDVDYIIEVNEWCAKVDACLMDLRIELMRDYNVKNPFMDVRKYVESMNRGE